MSLECSECERDLRGGCDPTCSRYREPYCCTCYLLQSAHKEQDDDHEFDDGIW